MERKTMSNEYDNRRETMKTTRVSEYERAERAVDAANNGKEMDASEEVKNPSIFGIGTSFIKSGINSLRLSFTNDPKTKAEIEQNEKNNVDAREATWNSYKKNLGTNILSDAIDTVMVVGTVAAVASGVGAVGLGAAALVRAGVGMAVKTAVRRGITQTIIKSAQESVKQTIRNPVAQERILGVLRGEVADTVKFLGAKIPHGVRSAIAQNVTAPIRAIAHHVHQNIGRGFKYFGLPSAGFTAYGMGEGHLKPAVNAVVRNQEAGNNAKRILEQNGKVTVTDVLDSKAGRSNSHSKHPVEVDAEKMLGQPVRPTNKPKQNHDVKSNENHSGGSSLSRKNSTPNTKHQDIDKMLEEKSQPRQKSSLFNVSQNGGTATTHNKGQGVGILNSKSLAINDTHSILAKSNTTHKV